MSDDNKSPEVHVGKGRSAVVTLAHDPMGRALARKVFTGDWATKPVLYLLTGSANPYTWCRPAMSCAVIRRRILSVLVPVWFGDRLRLPRHDGWGWNQQHQAFELRSELIDGRHAPLIFPDASQQPDYLKILVDKVMKPLQRHLEDSGFDGLLWQAGKGNPVASNNFMLENSTQDELRWVWIDLESGVPALFALNPLATLGFYIPKSWHHGRWLFDDVDTGKLRSYISGHQEMITQVHGPDACEKLLLDVDELEKDQHAWRSIRRYQRNIAYERSQQRLTDEQAAWYNTRPLRWYLYITPRTAGRVIKAIGTGLTRVVGKVTSFPFHTLTRRSYRYLASSRYRWGVARWLVGRSIKSWQQRGFIDSSTSCRLRLELHNDEASGYLTDFSFHILLKPLVKVIQWGILPALLIGGVISELTFALLLVTGGPISRTIYTFIRMLQAVFRRHRLPWVALLIGLLPMAGNAAYPMQLLYSSTESAGSLARFIIYDIAARIGRAVPVWGGADTQVEHFFNRACDVVIRTLSRSV